MNTYLPYTAVTETYTFPSTPDVGTVAADVVFDKSGESIPKTLSLVSGNEYRVVVADDFVDSAGTYYIKWSCTIGGDAFYVFTNFDVSDVYISSTTFFANNSEYSGGEYASKFDQREKDARRIIDTYTGQDFQFIKNKTLAFAGSGKNTLYIPQRINSFTSVLVDDVDHTAEVELDVRSHYYVKLSTSTVKFSENSTVKIKGDWGWRDVPWEIAQAAELLVLDLLEDTRREHKRYGITRLWQDTNRMEFHPSILNSTGNTDVDTLLMDYVIWTMDYVT